MSGSRETRITIWNRRKLLAEQNGGQGAEEGQLGREALPDDGAQAGEVRRALQRHQDPGPIRRGCPPQQGAAPTAVQDSVLTYTIYVHRDDYDRAFAAIQSSLRGK